MAQSCNCFAVRSPNVDKFEESTISALPLRDYAFRFAVPAPEEISPVGFGAGRKSLERIDYERGEGHINGSSCLGLVEQQAIPVQAVSLKEDRVADAQAAPTHEKRESP